MGPPMRVIELVSVSSASARGTSSGATLSPTMRRRVDSSVDQTVPATNAATARCHGRAAPNTPSNATVADAADVTNWPTTIRRLRFTASAITPAKAPSTSIGMVRAADTTATARPEPVMSSVNNAAASTSNQRIALTQPPMAQSRMKVRDANSARTPFWRLMDAASVAFRHVHRRNCAEPFRTRTLNLRSELQQQVFAREVAVELHADWQTFAVQASRDVDSGQAGFVAGH